MNVSTAKNFSIKSEDIKPLVESSGWCLATDRIMVHGLPIGHMYRETPVAGGDSGWRFFAGDEDDAYMAGDGNHGVYDLNTVVNYDPAVIPYLAAAPGSRFDKAADGAYVRLE
ncbi:MAG TPA: DUF2185 domain-containing protein [Variovorax sp.]|nr:DUF2185 domain-containing protein [Variovorax sp.]